MLLTSDHDTPDAWFLRIGITIFGAGAVWGLVRGIICKVSLEGRKGFWKAVRRHWLYILLAVLPGYILLAFGLALLIENYTGSGKAYFYMISLGHVIYGILETQISYSRMPKALMSNIQWTVLVSLTKVGLLMAILRVTANMMMIVKIFGSNKADIAELEVSRWNTALVAINMVGAAYFTGTELFIYHLTSKMSLSSSAKLTVIMKLLTYANMFGSFAGFWDIINQYVQIQTSEAMVMALGTRPLIFYSRVFMLQDDPLAEVRSEARMEKWESSIPEKPPSIAQTMAAY